MKRGEWETSIDQALMAVRSNLELQRIWVDLMGYGYFPNQLPPPFQSTIFSREINDSQESFINIIKAILWPTRKGSMLSARLYRYSYARPKQLRRMFSLPNPMHFILLTLEIAANFSTISTIANSSAFSMSKPTKPNREEPFEEFDGYEFDEDDEEHGSDEENDEELRLRCLEFSNTWEELAEKKLNIRSGAKYIAKADIARFFPTIYTHILPWIFHGKSIAKTQRNDYTLLGNRIDTLIRSSQDGQTLGFPIGPDTSFLLSECILSKIDEAIQVKLKNYDYKACRMVDDYEFACLDRSTAEKCLSVLQEVLLEYELELNSLKSEVLELPQAVQPHEFFHLRTFDLKAPDSTNFVSRQAHEQMTHSYKMQLLNFIDLAFQSYNSGKAGGVLKFAIKKVKPVPFSTNIFIDFMCHCMLLEPGSIETVLQKVAKLNLWSDPQITDAFSNCFAQIIKVHSELGHSSEVAWALWGYILFEQPIENEITLEIAKMNDSIVLLLALDASERGLMQKGHIRKKIKEFLNKDSLYGEHWLLAYETVQKGWAPPGYRSHVRDNDFFKKLKAESVEFYNSQATERYRQIMQTWEPDYGYNEE